MRVCVFAHHLCVFICRHLNFYADGTAEVVCICMSVTGSATFI